MTNALRRNAFSTVVFAIVIVGLVLAFRVLGSPSQARQLAEDRQRVADLEAIAHRIERRYGRSDVSLPTHLPRDLIENESGADTIGDPATHAPYEYHLDGQQRYRLCATFARARLAYDTADGDVPDAERHPAGHRCRAFVIHARRRTNPVSFRAIERVVSSSRVRLRCTRATRTIEVVRLQHRIRVRTPETRSPRNEIVLTRDAR